MSEMDSRYYEFPTGSPEHRAAYREAFAASDGIGFPDPGDPDLSYEIDNAVELAAERYAAEADAGDSWEAEADAGDSWFLERDPQPESAPMPEMEIELF